MAMGPVRAVMQHQGCHPEEGSDVATISSDPLGYVVTGGGVGAAHPGTAGGAVVTIGDSSNGFGSSGGAGDGRGGGGGGLQREGADGVNQLEEDRKTRRRQVERTTIRLSRVS